MDASLSLSTVPILNINSLCLCKHRRWLSIHHKNCKVKFHSVLAFVLETHSAAFPPSFALGQCCLKDHGCPPAARDQGHIPVGSLTPGINKHHPFNIFRRQEDLRRRPVGLTVIQEGELEQQGSKHPPGQRMALTASTRGNWLFFQAWSPSSPMGF